MKKYYKIGELARLYDISADSLRYYERLGLLSPKRTENHYRCYSLEDIWKLNVIRDLRRLGFPMEKIRQYLENCSVDTTLALLQEEAFMVDRQTRELKQLQQELQLRRETIEKTRRTPEGRVAYLHYPKRGCLRIQEPFRQDAEADLLMQRLLNRSDDLTYIIGNNRIGSVLPLDQAGNGRFQAYSSMFLIEPEASCCDFFLEEGVYASVFYHGSNRRNEEMIPVLLKAIRENGKIPAGDILELLWIDIHETSDPGEFVTELQVRTEDVSES